MNTSTLSRPALKTCTSCAHHMAEHYGWVRADFCTNFPSETDVVTGKQILVKKLCWRERRAEFSGCGMGAKHWAPKPEKRPPFWVRELSRLLGRV